MEMRRSSTFCKQAYVCLGLITVCFVMLLSTEGTLINRAEAQEAAQGMPGSDYLNSPFKWINDEVEDFGYLGTRGGQLVSGDALRVRFDPGRNCSEAEVFTTFYLPDVPEGYSFQGPQDIQLHKAITGFLGVDTDKIETIDAKIVAVSDMGAFKVALISLGFDQVNNWIGKLDGLSLKLSVSDDAPPVAALFKNPENSWDLRYFPEAASEAQLQCRADHTAGLVRATPVNAATQLQPSPFMSQAAAQRFGDWWSGRFSRLAFNHESIEATEEDVSEKVDDWEIEFFGETMIMVTKPGRITHGDRLMFRLNPKENCDQAEMITSFYSVERNPNFMGLKGKVIGFEFAVDEPNVVDKEDSTTTAGGTVVAASSFLAGHRATLTFGYLPVDYWKLWMDGKTASLTMLEGNGIVPEAYFDITNNNWGLDGFVEKINKASEICHGSQTVERT
jgi:hypothetical protein